MTEPTQSGISRRTLAKGAAWSVPAVAVAAAAPAYAKSGIEECLTFTLTGNACKFPGSGNSWAYKLQFTICNTCPNPITFTIGDLQNNSGKDLVECSGGPIEGATITVPGGTATNPGCTTTAIAYYTSTSSAAKIVIYDTNGAVLGEVFAPPSTCTELNPCINNLTGGGDARQAQEGSPATVEAKTPTTDEQLNESPAADAQTPTADAQTPTADAQLNESPAADAAAPAADAQLNEAPTADVQADQAPAEPPTDADA